MSRRREANTPRFNPDLPFCLFLVSIAVPCSGGITARCAVGIPKQFFLCLLSFQATSSQTLRLYHCTAKHSNVLVSCHLKAPNAGKIRSVEDVFMSTLCIRQGWLTTVHKKSIWPCTRIQFMLY